MVCSVSLSATLPNATAQPPRQLHGPSSRTLVGPANCAYGHCQTLLLWRCQDAIGAAPCPSFHCPPSERRPSSQLFLGFCCLLLSLRQAGHAWNCVGVEACQILTAQLACNLNNMRARQTRPRSHRMFSLSCSRILSLPIPVSALHQQLLPGLLLLLSVWPAVEWLDPSACAAAISVGQNCQEPSWRKCGMKRRRALDPEGRGEGGGRARMASNSQSRHGRQPGVSISALPWRSKLHQQ